MFDAHVNTWEIVYDASLGVGHEFTNGYVLGPDGRVIKDGVVYFDDGQWIGTYDWRNAIGKLYRHTGPDASGATTADLGEDAIEFAAWRSQRAAPGTSAPTSRTSRAARTAPPPPPRSPGPRP